MIEKNFRNKAFFTLIVYTFAFFFLACSSGPQKQVIKRSYNVSSASEQKEVSNNVKWNKRNTDELAPGYQIEIKCLEDQVVNGIFTIQADGVLKLPYEVKIDTSGLKLSSLKSELVNSYKKYLTNPKIDVSIFKKEYYVDVRGLVQKPGQYLVKEDSSLDFLISQAGGLLAGTEKNAAAEYVKIDQLGGYKCNQTKGLFFRFSRFNT